MQTFKQFLSEANAPDLVSFIEGKCSQFLSESGRKGLLRRGMKRFDIAGELSLNDRTLPYGERSPRLDRKPTDTMGAGAPVLDLEAYGRHAAYILPVGHFRIVWSPKVRDLYSTLSDNRHNLESIADFLDSLGYTDGDLEDAVQSKTEVMLSCSKYIILPFSRRPEWVDNETWGDFTARVDKQAESAAAVSDEILKALKIKG
jgi:hypothetical protein